VEQSKPCVGQGGVSGLVHHQKFATIPLATNLTDRAVAACLSRFVTMKKPFWTDFPQGLQLSETVMVTVFHAKYFAHELTKRCSSDSLEKLAASLADAQVDLNPHQIDAALFAFRSPLSKGAILADEVGLGKTIEAGILLSQKWAERRRKLLIIVPANLRKQWNQELSDKFFLPSVILETRSFNEQIKQGNLNPFEQGKIVICSYNFARAKDAYIKQVQWDLVTIDEAHRLRNVYKPANRIANAIKIAVADFHKILLTATPLQNSLLELFGLVSIIDDYTFGDLKSFKSQFSNLTTEQDFNALKARLKPICQRTLRRQVLEYIPFTNRKAIVQEFYPTQEEQRLYDLVSDYLQRDRLFALPSSQRQLMTLILRKLLASSTYAISGTLTALSEKLETVAKEQAMPEITPEEIAPDYEAVDNTEEEWNDNGDAGEKKTYTPEELEQMSAEARSLREFQQLAQSIVKNSKGEVLLTALKKGFAAATEKGAQKKAIIFTESRRTQAYLRDLLEATEYTGKIVLFNGSNSDPKSKEIYRNWLAKHEGTDRITGSPSADMRAALVDYFREEAIIMIATEAAAEGINLQFCSLVVNYDLPWNPQRIEQRIGRCHRYGQKCDVVVVNFLNKANAADVRVYQLLDEKFKLFDGVFGASDEVLGSIESGVDFEKRIAEIYQTCRTPEQIEFNFNQLQTELETNIDEKMRMTRQKLLENFDAEVQEKLKIKNRESSEYLNRFENWLWLLTNYFLREYADFDGDEHSFILKQNPFPGENIHPGPYRVGKNVEDANLYRVGHPLAQRIIEQCKSLPCEPAEVVFHYSRDAKTISILEPHVGKSGALSLQKYTVSAIETEDWLMFAGVCDDGTPIDAEQCQWLFSLEAEISSQLPMADSDSVSQRLEEQFAAQRQVILASLGEKNARFFEQEMEKLERWASDLKDSLEHELKDLDREIKEAKREAQLTVSLEQKLALHKHIKDLEKRRAEKRHGLFQAQDAVDTRKDSLLTEIETRLRQNAHEEALFTLRWRVA
jgi:ERCC4-related helicase